MIFYLHYILMTSGLSGTQVLLGVYLQAYTDASQGEIGVLLMSFPFVCLIIKPLFCSLADQRQAHQLYFTLALTAELIGYAPFAIVPFFPSFYQAHPRVAWYLLVIGCHLGNAGLGVAWSLGDCLAMNMSQKTGVPFGRMRLMGTISWGFYGFVIGQINEVWFLPKYVPAFFILLASILIEIVLISSWKKEDFEMVDTFSSDPTKSQPSTFIDSVPSSLCGTLRLGRTRSLLQQEQERYKTLSSVMQVSSCDTVGSKMTLSGQRLAQVALKLKRGLSYGDFNEEPKHEDNALATVGRAEEGKVQEQQHSNRTENPQLALLRMIFAEDGRIIKYVMLFIAYGFLIAPMNFIFLSFEEISRERDYNFSQLVGSVLISQASIETVVFMILPWCMGHVSRCFLLSFGLLVQLAKYGFYASYFYQVNPYWAVLSEWSLGITYGIGCTIQAEVALMFANQARLFTSELRRLGYLSEEHKLTKQQLEAEERSVKMALRATMQAIFDGFMTGLGQGAGSMICGFLVESYSYVALWKLFSSFSLGSLLIYLLIELTKSRWSDSYQPSEGTKAYEIKQLETAEKQKGSQKMVIAAH